MPRKTKNSMANSKATSTDIPSSSKAGKAKNKNKNGESTATSSPTTQPLSKQELAILFELNKRNKAAMSVVQAQKDSGMSWLLR
jgi:hypothetical protein